MLSTILTVPGGGTPNEDAAAASTDLLVVLDGLTSPPSLGTGCAHGTPWYVRHLAARLIERASVRQGAGLAGILAEAIDAVGTEHRGCDLAHPGTPSATVGLLRAGADTVDYLVLADCTALIDSGGHVEAVTDPRAEQMEPGLQSAVLTAPLASAQRAAALDAWITVQRGYRNQPGGYWIAGSVPEAADHALTGTRPTAEVRSAAVMSDGASRYSDTFALGDWTEALAAIDHSPSAVIARVRACEHEDAQCVRWPRFKTSDDATIAFWRPAPGRTGTTTDE
ncbi:MAG TPA: protein phosphatase 2C domain-containing protein [Actinocrinis sp.]|jgi:hypothetical protein|nr:protein phosphatase 2C domain-containing protein [Actinocrinis sp.]